MECRSATLARFLLVQAETFLLQAFLRDRSIRNRADRDRVAWVLWTDMRK
jgi:hypothetical protein